MLSRRRSASKERQQTADERLDELLANQTPARRTQSAEPSARRPALVKSTRQAPAAGTPGGARTDPRTTGAGTDQLQLEPSPGTMLAGLLPPLPGGGLLGGGTMAAAEVMQGQLRDQLPGGWSILQGPYPQGHPVVFHPGGATDASGQLPILPGRREREGGTMAEEASTSRVELSHGDRERQRGGPQPDQALRPCRVPDPVPEQYEGELGGQHGRDVVTVGAMSRQQSPINPWSAEKIKETMNLPQSQSQEAGETVELLRQRVLRDAEQRFADGVRQLLGGGNPPSDASFKTAAENGGATQGDGKQQVLETGGPRQPSGTGTQVASSSTMTTSGGVPVPGGNLPGPGPVQGTGPGVCFPWPYPPGIQLGPGGWGAIGLPPNGGGGGGNYGPGLVGGAPMGGGNEESVNETFRSVDLPPLPSDANALSFGDWLATIQPLIADVSVSAEEWWAVTLKGVDELYTQWLASDPLQRLRLDTGTSSAATRWPRTERRMTSLLLQAAPDNIKAEAVAARKLSVTHLLFTLFVKFQPGGQGERVTLIRFLTELKTTGSMVELAQKCVNGGDGGIGLKSWR